MCDVDPDPEKLKNGEGFELQHVVRHLHSLETSLLDGIAVGDVCLGSIKRVASAVGEGSTAISITHKVR